jgi:hypothetical protein
MVDHVYTTYVRISSHFFPWKRVVLRYGGERSILEGVPTIGLSCYLIRCRNLTVREEEGRDTKCLQNRKSDVREEIRKELISH